MSRNFHLPFFSALVLSLVLLAACGQKDASTEEAQILLVHWEDGTDIFSGCGTGLLDDISSLAWLAPRRNFELIGDNITKEENEWIQKSSACLDPEGNPLSFEEIREAEEADDSFCWVRVVQEIVPPQEGTTVTGYKDYLLYRQGEDACIAIQSPEDTSLWTVWRIPEYGNWLEHELLLLRMQLGL